MPQVCILTTASMGSTPRRLAESLEGVTASCIRVPSRECRHAILARITHRLNSCAY